MVTTRTRLQDSRVETRERILRAARQALCDHGYAGTTARSIAAIGGFTPGVIYYHFSDLDDLLVATAAYSSAERMTRYRAELNGVTSAAILVKRLRSLYAEDVDTQHIESMQELLAGARPDTPLAAAMAEQTQAWEQLAEELLRQLLRGSPVTRFVDVKVAARAAVAYFLGMQTLTHLDRDQTRADAAFRQAARLASFFDKLPRIRRGTAARS